MTYFIRLQINVWKKTILLIKKEGAPKSKKGSTISIPGTKLGTCQVSAQKVDPWSRYARDIRTDGRTDTGEF